MNRSTLHSSTSRWSAGAVLAVLVAVWIGIVLIAVVVVRHLEDSVLAVAGQGLARSAASLGESISRVVYEHAMQARTMAQAAPLRHAGVESAVEYVRSVQAALPEYMHVDVLDALGRVVAASDPVKAGAEEGEMPWVRAMRQMERFEGRHVEMFDRAGRTLIFPSPIMGDEGNVIGAVVLRVDLRSLEFLFDAARRSSAGTHEGTGLVEYRLLDENGTVLYEAGVTRSGRFDAGLMVDRVPTGSPRPGYRYDVHPERAVPTVTGYALVNRYGNVEHAAPGMQWVVTARMDRRNIVAPFHRRIERLMGWGAAALAGVLAVLAWLITRLQRTLRPEIATMTQVPPPVSPVSPPRRGPPIAESAPKEGRPESEAIAHTDLPALAPAAWEGLKHWVRLADVNRVALFKNHQGEGGTQWASRRYEWIGRGEVARSEWSQWFSWSLRAKGFGRWEETLSRRQVVSGAVDSFPEVEATALRSCGIRNVVVVPLFVRDEWWGFVEFDHCLSEREWSDAEVQGLIGGAAVLEAAIAAADEHEFQRIPRVLDGVLESTTDGVLVVDADGRVVNFNQRLVAMWRMPDAVAGARTIDEVTEWMMRHLKVPELLLRTVNELDAAPETESYDILELLDGRLIERVSAPHHDGARIDGRIWTFRELTTAADAMKGAGSPTEERTS